MHDDARWSFASIVRPIAFYSFGDLKHLIIIIKFITLFYYRIICSLFGLVMVAATAYDVVIIHWWNDRVLKYEVIYFSI